MGLSEYNRKRNFRTTPEPPPKRAATKGWSYTVQKHAASHLHYDFRLELDGVLKSWAVPKGPSLNPRVRRLALQVEDHPVAYGTFEGTIPQGEYGGGTVMLWDHGTWEPVGDPREGLRQGKLKFQVHGDKLRGGWMLVKRSASSQPRGKDNQWFLIKERDEAAQSDEDLEVVESEPLSVSSRRDLDEIAAGAPRKKRGVKKRRSRGRARSSSAGSQMPDFVEPQLATLASLAPEGDQWIHEIKLDGYRMQCRIAEGHARFLSRNRQDWTNRLEKLAAAASKLPVTEALLDGEVVALAPDGKTDFQALQNAFNEGRGGQLLFFVFDLLFLDGRDLRPLPLEERKQALARVLGKKTTPAAIHYTDHVLGNGPEFFIQASKLGLEGIISKRRDRPSVSGRATDWLKVKCLQREEFVIGGYTDPAGARQGFGALLLGHHNGGPKLVYAGKVGTGFDERLLGALTARLSRLTQATSPFSNLTRAPRGAHWVKPQLVAQIAFSNWTRDGHLRHPAFLGLREDKPASEVVRDKAIDISPTKQSHPMKTATQRRASPKSSSSDGLATVAQSNEFAGVRLTHPDRVLYAEDGITKLELAQYYFDVAKWMLPHVANRPVVLVRCPDGSKKQCFYQKHPGAGSPTNLRQIPVRESGKTENYLVVDDAEGLISLAQVSALEIHAWGSHADKLETPDRLIFDLDPDPAVAWERVVESAHQIRRFLQDLGLESFVKTTGGKGLHLVVPIQRRHEWDEAKEFTKQVADRIVQADPTRYIAQMSKAARKGKIFIDYLRNGRGATSVAPYSTRSNPHAPVSVPLSWEELTSAIRSDQFTIRNLRERLAKLKRDPWSGIDKVRQSLSASVRKKLG